MAEINLDTLKNRSIRGVIAFSVRTFFLQVVALIGTLLLAAFLTPSEFGIFFVVTAIVNLFVFLSDVGLAASLIQKKEPPTRDDLATTFTIQQVLAISIFVIIFLLRSVWENQFNLEKDAIGLLLALAFSFILASLKTIPSVLLERDLEFNKLVFPQVIENIVFYTITVGLASQGFGVSSYTYAVLARGIVGAIIIYALRPWMPQLSLSKESLKKLLKFGVPFQLNDLLARIKDDLLIVALKKILTSAEIGYLGWAQRWALFPFRFTVDSVIRVTFPAYSRLQNQPEELKKAIEKSIFFISLIILPLLAGMGIMAYPLTVVVDKYAKWQPALPALQLFIINIAFSSISTPLTNALNAIGKISITLRLMVFWTILTWTTAIPLVLKVGFLGAAISSAIVAATSIFTVRLIQREVSIQVLSNIFPQLLAASIMFVSLNFFQNFASESFSKFISVIFIGAIVYSGAVWIIMGQKLKEELKKLHLLKK